MRTEISTLERRAIVAMVKRSRAADREAERQRQAIMSLLAPNDVEYVNVEDAVLSTTANELWPVSIMLKRLGISVTRGKRNRR